MLYPPGLSSYGFAYDNWGADPSATPGVSVTPGASNAEGSWTEIAAAASLTEDCYWMQLVFIGGAVSNNDKSQIADIGVDPAGGTSYTAAISNLVCGASDSVAGMPTTFIFPLYIKAGSSVAVRIQGSNATAGTVRVAARFLGQPSRPECVPVGMFSETIGTITNSGGQSFTPGNSTPGAWQSLGTTVQALWWWQLGVQISNTTSTERCFVDLAYGDGSNKHIIIRSMRSGLANEANNMFLNGNWFGPCNYWHVPAGSTLYVRGHAENAPDTGYNAVAVGIGG